MNNKFKTSIPPMSIDEQGMCRGGFISGDIESSEINNTTNRSGKICVNGNCSNVKNKTSAGCSNTNCESCTCDTIITPVPDGPILL